MEWSTRSFEALPFFTNTIRSVHNAQDIIENHADRSHLEDEDEYHNMLDAGGEGQESDSEASIVHVGTGTGSDFGKHILTLWNKRKTQMVLDYAIPGWLLSPLEDVLNDVRVERAGVHNDAMDRLLTKMNYNLTEEELGELKDTFWTEFDEFTTKTGRFGGPRKYIWNSDLIRRRKSAKWHAQYSVAFTQVRWSLLLCVFSFSFCLLYLIFVFLILAGTW
jgi:hypothetical protein